MSDPKGPQVELPPELREDLETEYSEEGASPQEAGEAEAGAAAPSTNPGDLERQLGEQQDKYLRLAAEFDNFRRRSLRERQDALRYGNENLMKELLGTVDNLERAVDHGLADALGEEGAKVFAGVDLTLRSLLQTLEKFGVKQVPAEGEPFDPSVHQAIRQVPSDDTPPGSVAEVLQKGYLLADRLLRPALVGVSSGPADKPEDS